MKFWQVQKPREEALEILSKPPYDLSQALKDKTYVAKKLGISTDEFDSIIKDENKTPDDYKNSFWMIKLGVWFCKLLGIENRNIR